MHILKKVNGKMINFEAITTLYSKNSMVLTYTDSTGTDNDIRFTSTDGDPTVEVGYIQTASDLPWDLGGYTAGAPTADGYLTVVVNGTTYRVAVDKQ